METQERSKVGERAVWLSISAYILLAAVKIAIAYVYHSNALLADGFNNSTDVLASAAILIGLRIARKPPDEDHRYGHSRAETVASLVASFIIALVGLQVIVSTIGEIVDHRSIEVPDMVTAWTALGCGILIYAVYLYNLRIAKRTNSLAVRAAAMDNRSDAWVSFGAFIGISGSQFGLPWLDPFTALIVGLLICKTAWEIFRDSSHDLTDGFDEQLLERYRETIRSTPGVRSIKNVRARMYGNQIFVDATIYLSDEDMNVRESHLITEEIEMRMNQDHGVAETHIHIEPRS